MARPKREFSPTEERIIALLSDGDRHSKQEIFNRCIDDQLSNISVVASNISAIRPKLPQGHLIVCETSGPGPTYYRHCIKLASPYHNE